MKFLFTEEYVGSRDWKNRRKIINKYYEIEENPFVRKEQTCGYSKSDFDIILDALKRNGVEINDI